MRQYLEVVRRQWLLLALALVLGVALGAFLHLTRTPVYGATTEVLLKPNDPVEQITAGNQQQVDLTNYAEIQLNVITARDVAQRAAKVLKTTPKQVEDAVTAKTGDTPSVLQVTATDTDPVRAAQIANAAVAAFIGERRDTQVRALNQAADGIDTQLDALRKQISALPNTGTTANGNQSAALTAASQQLATLTGRQSDLRIEASLKRGEASVLSQAVPPEVPLGTSLPVEAVLGGMLGLMLGLGLAFTRNQLDDRVRGREQLERATGIPVLAELPADRATTKQGRYLATAADPLGALAEATRSLRTSVTFLGVEEPIRRMMVTSGLPGEGKTLVSMNLAASFAQSGVRTVLVSADLRRSRLESALGIRPGRAGLSTLLVSGAGLQRRMAPAAEEGTARLRLHSLLLDTLIPTEVEGLSLLPAGPHPPNPAELLGSRHMDEVLEELEQMFELIVIDTSPVLAVADAAALAAKAEHVLVVASGGMTRGRALERTLSVLRRTQTNVLGLVLNRAAVDPTLGSGRYYGQKAAQRGSKRRPVATSAVQSRPPAPASAPTTSPATSTATPPAREPDQSESVVGVRPE